ncbi:MAG: exodeoxyribonuclease III [Cyanobacteria bacterium HKST-UBA04]|nr:exodeoxyribonuclease III [Cyanobacteria bacterium HKST-UBA05]MCA9798327.1 exodeoxyribonuclease III [Cyanobacteria bacterium HKST-UBA04]MCA9841554.1 exodeoxyribonuclease III [Cyanobacteria bacterium HKST-UBA03]
MSSRKKGRQLVSWNVNGIRAVAKKGFYDWFAQTQPFVLGLQETKISAHQLTPDLTDVPGYVSYWSHAERPGYSGTALFCREKPLKVTEGLGVPEFDTEGRTLVAEFDDFVLYNIYFPNGQRSDDRLDYKLRFYDAFLEVFNRRRAQGKPVIVCGDLNTAHHPIDLARPKANEDVSGFLPIERAWMDKLVGEGYVDTFRHFHPDEPDRYSWWNMRSRARERNVGWRIDYFFTSSELAGAYLDADIHDSVQGSDHCPVSLTLT